METKNNPDPIYQRLLEDNFTVFKTTLDHFNELDFIGRTIEIEDKIRELQKKGLEGHTAEHKIYQEIIQKEEEKKKLEAENSVNLLEISNADTHLSALEQAKVHVIRAAVKK